MVDCFAWGLEMCPAGLGRHPEDVLGAVLVRVLRVGSLFPFAFEEDVPFFEGIGDVFQKNDSKDDMLVFGRVHTAAQGVGHTPQLGLIAGRRTMGVRISAGIGLQFSRSSSCHTSSFLRQSPPRPFPEPASEA